MMNPGLKEIAEACGVTIATVSLALNGKAGVGQHTRERIRRMAEQLGYQRQEARHGLGRGHRGASPIRVGWVEAPELTLEETRAFRRVLGGELRSRGYELRAYPSQVLAGEIATFCRRERLAILVPHALDSGSELCRQDWPELVILCFERNRDPLPFYTVRSNTAAAARLMMRRVLTCGHRRVGLLPVTTNTPDIVQREALEGWVSEYYLQTGEWPGIPPFHLQAGREPALVPWVRQHQPEVILTTSPQTGGLLQQAGFSIPADFAFATLHARRRAPWSGIQLRTAANARVLAENIDYYFRHGLAGVRRVPSESILPGQWVKGMIESDNDATARRAARDAGRRRSRRESPYR